MATMAVRGHIMYGSLKPLTRPSATNIAVKNKLTPIISQPSSTGLHVYSTALYGLKYVLKRPIVI